MRKVIISSFLILVCTLYSSAQSFEKGNIKFDVGIGLGIYGTELETDIPGQTGQQSDLTASVIIPIKAQYGISNKFGLGVTIQPANYVENSDSATTRSEENKGTAFRIFTNYYFLNKDKFNMYAELGIGAATFNQEVNESDGDNWEANWGGSNFTLGLGMNYFFGEKVGLFSNFGYNNYAFELEEVTNNNVTLDVSGWKARFKGAEINIGLSVKF